MLNEFTPQSLVAFFLADACLWCFPINLWEWGYKKRIAHIGFSLRVLHNVLDIRLIQIM